MGERWKNLDDELIAKGLRPGDVEAVDVDEVEKCDEVMGGRQHCIGTVGQRGHPSELGKVHDVHLLTVLLMAHCGEAHDVAVEQRLR